MKNERIVKCPILADDEVYCDVCEKVYTYPDLVRAELTATHGWTFDGASDHCPKCTDKHANKTRKSDA